MSYSDRGVRILLVGDDGVGKTSLILSLVTEEFPTDVPPRAEEITIPADVTPEKVPTHIVDYSYEEQTDEELRDDLEQADVICVVYACDSDESIQNITTFWLPMIFDVCGDQNKPIVLVGNKSDTMAVEGEKLNTLLAIMDQYPQIETCIECSAYELKNISELFYYAQKAVLHPTAPLFSHEEDMLTERCQNGLIRIFKICDLDNDGVLNDTELNEFQMRCFKNPLPQHGLQEVKNIIQKNMEDGVNSEGVTLPGFLFLHSLFIQKGRQETTWTALRRFGYSQSLDMREDYLFPNLQKGSDCSVELSTSGLDFVMDLFYKYDQDEDDALNPEELSNLISLCEENPWNEKDMNASCTNENGWITAEGFIAQWILWTFIDYKWTLKNMAQLGFITSDMENQLSSVRITRSKAVDRQKQKTTRTVFLVNVIGKNGCGKTSFLQTFLNKTFNETGKYSDYAINSVQTSKQEVHVILREVSTQNAKDLLSEARHDANVFMYDLSDPTSFGPVAEVRKSIDSDTIPSLFIGTKSDLTKVKQDYSIQPNEYAVIHSPYPLQFFSSFATNSAKSKLMFSKIATMCTQVGHSSVSDKSFSKFALKYGVGLSIALGLGFLLIRFIRQKLPVSRT